MAGLGTSFDPNSVKPDTGAGGGLHPEGIFEFEIFESDVKAAGSGKGTVLKFTAQGTGNTDAPSDNKGLKIFENINVAHENAQAQAIGQGQLSALCAAIGFTDNLDDSEQLHYQPFWAEIRHEQQIDFKTKAKLFYDDNNPKMRAVIKRYMFEGMEEGTTDAPTPPAEKPAPRTPPAQPPATAGKKRPWDKS